MGNGARIVFPVIDDASVASTYGCRYLLSVRCRDEPVFHLTPADAAALAERCASTLPALRDAAKGLASLPPPIQDTLAAKRAIFLASWRAAFPLLDGERLVTEDVTCTAAEWDGTPAGTIVYLRTTDLGRLALLIENAQIDDSGRLAYAPVATSPDVELPAPAPARKVLGDPSAVDILKSSLQMLTWIGFGMGTKGSVAFAAGAGVLETIFSLALGSTTADLPTAISGVVQQDIAVDHVSANLTKILTYTTWWKNQNQAALSGSLSDADQAKFQDALAQTKDTVDEACSPNNALLQTISDLQNGTYPCDPGYDILGLAAFVLAATTHLLFAKARILLDTDATTFHSPFTNDLVNSAQSYLDHIKSVQGKIDPIFSSRLGGIAGPSQGKFTESTYGTTSTTRAYIYVQDFSAASFPSQDILAPSTGVQSGGYAPKVVWFKICEAKGCSGTTSCDTNGAQAWLTSYTASVTSALAKKYNYSADRKADIQDAITKLQKVIDLYTPAMGTSATTT